MLTLFCVLCCWNGSKLFEIHTSSFITETCVWSRTVWFERHTAFLFNHNSPHGEIITFQFASGTQHCVQMFFCSAAGATFLTLTRPVSSPQHYFGDIPFWFNAMLYVLGSASQSNEIEDAYGVAPPPPEVYSLALFPSEIVRKY